MNSKIELIKQLNPNSLASFGYHSEYEPPTNGELYEFLSWTGYRLGELTDVLGFKKKLFQSYLKERSYLEGYVAPYALWRRMLEYFEIVDHEVMERHPLIKELKAEDFCLEDGREVYLSCFVIRSVFYRANCSFTRFRDLLKGDMKLVSEVLYGADPTMELKVDSTKWNEILAQGKITSLEEFNELPDLKNSINIFYTSYDGKYAEFPLTTDEKQYEMSKNPYRSPTSNQVKRFVGWTGYSTEKLAEVIGLKEVQQLEYAMKYTSTKESGITLTYDRWRLLLERFGVVEPLKLPRKTA